MKLILILAAAAAASFLPACNTTEGLGQDLQKLGSKIEDKASEAR